MTEPKENKPTFVDIGTKTDNISVELSTRFLEHFSEQLYSSPQKAFEELISNGWDAGASYVDVKISDDLSKSSATMSVLDNGTSMDDNGLKALWHIAFSEKEKQSEAHGRKVIGKFGIGKLATYVLANKLTYFCKSSDGKIRRVTMDYAGIQNTDDDNDDKLISETSLDIYEVELSDLREAVSKIENGEDILKLIENDIPEPNISGITNEFGGNSGDYKRPSNGTWTLAILSDLKATGKSLKLGVLKRMLSSALPFGSEMAIALNGEILESSKIEKDTLKEWNIGPDLKFTELSIPIEEGAEDNDSSNKKVVKVELRSKPEPHAYIEEIGEITGTVRLFEEKISTGKSELRGSSNGFHVNVLGRLVNQNDPSFGEENLSHSAWSRFRMAVRADGLNPSLITNREQFKETYELKVFRAFLRKVFNLARNKYDSDPTAGLSDGGDVLVKALGVISLNPLRTMVSETLSSKPPIDGMFDESKIEDRAHANEQWRKKTADDISSALGEVKYESTDDDEFAKFRIHDSALIVNKKHPFVLEHTKKAEKELIRTFAMVNLLTDMYALESGIDAEILKSMREYRDRLLRFRARQTRQSGLHIAELLLTTQNDSNDSKQLEAVVSDALSYLGFDVNPMGKPGEPEGVAEAFTTPSNVSPTKDDPNPPLYRFTYDAKSSKKNKAKTGNLSLDGITEHRKRYNANYALVVAPGFQEGAAVTRCEQQKITPIAAKDLGRLLELTAKHGAIPLPQLRELFNLYDPSQVSDWVDTLEETLENSNKLTLKTFLEAIHLLRKDVPDALDASLISHTCRKNLDALEVEDKDVKALATGLQVIVPNLVGVDENRIIINASSERVAEAVDIQLESLRKSHETNND